MRTTVQTALLAVLCLLIACTLAVSASIQWDDAPPGYTVRDDGSILASDGGQSTPDHYLLTRDAYSDFILELDIKQAGPVGERPRSIICWAVDPQDHGNRTCYFIQSSGVAKDKWTHMRLVVLGGNAALSVNGSRVGGNPTVYGIPMEQGRVGLLTQRHHEERKS